jgi:hypothetical protein
VIQVRRSKDQLLLPVRVTPRGGRDCLLPFTEGDTTLKIKVSVPPEDGKANAAVIQLFAEILDIPKRRLCIHSGETSRHKQVSIVLNDASEAEKILALMEQALGAKCLVLVSS